MNELKILSKSNLILVSGTQHTLAIQHYRIRYIVVKYELQLQRAFYTSIEKEVIFDFFQSSSICPSFQASLTALQEVSQQIPFIP